MPIPELERFRQKYPQYNDMDDISLATKLATKYPEYSDLVNKVSSEKPPSLYKSFGAEITPEMEQKSPYVSAVGKTLQEGIGTPTLHFLNQAALNYPRALAAKGGYSYPEAETTAGKVLSKSAGVAGLLTSPVLRGIMAVGKGGGILKQTAMGALKGGAIGGLYSPSDVSDLGARIKNAETGAITGGALGAGGSILESISKYPKEKVLAIRKGAKTYHKQEVTAYGDMLKSLSNDPQGLDPIPAIDKMEELMKVRGIVSPEGKTLTPTNSVDRQLVKSYNELMRKWASSQGKLSVGDIAQELQKIKDVGKVGGEPTQLGRLAVETGHEILNSVKPQIKSDIFQKGNIRYTDFKQNMEALNRYFDIWGNPKLTARGENFITRGMGKTGEAKEIAKLAIEKAGQTLKGGKFLSGLNRLASNKLLRYGLLGGGVGGGIALTRKR